jgi:hypothetical protein
MSIFRKIRDDEKALIIFLIEGISDERKLHASLQTALVEEMEDGGMGSLRITWQGEDTARHFEHVLSTHTFLDSDGVEISIAINVDKHGDLFELDVWKVDFSPVKRFPTIEK